MPQCHSPALAHRFGFRAADKAGVEVASLLREVPPKGMVPTYFKTNKVTVGFQAIVDAYGVAKYLEFNPTPFTVITFPFLFAVMFGDVAHGAIMLAFALYMVLNESYFLKNKVRAHKLPVPRALFF